MIHEVLPSDVELAQGMLNDSYSDAQILAALTSRSIEPVKAAQLVDDLRHGRPPRVQVSFALGSTTHRVTSGPTTPKDDAPQTADSRPPHSRHRSHKRGSGSWWIALLVVIGLWALWYVWVKAGAEVSQDAIDFHKHQVPEPPTKDAPR